jgi:putative transcriptional regulator
MSDQEVPGPAEVPPDPRLRERVLDLADAPALPIDPAAYTWQEPHPGLRLAVVRVDAKRGFVAQLLWARPGARLPLHRHHGDENVLVLQGAFRDEDGRYGPGQVARRRAGSIHSVEALPGPDCISYVVSYGDIEML